MLQVVVQYESRGDSSPLRLPLHLLALVGLHDVVLCRDVGLPLVLDVLLLGPPLLAVGRLEGALLLLVGLVRHRLLLGDLGAVGLHPLLPDAQAVHDQSVRQHERDAGFLVVKKKRGEEKTVWEIYLLDSETSHERRVRSQEIGFGAEQRSVLFAPFAPCGLLRIIEGLPEHQRQSSLAKRAPWLVLLFLVLLFLRFFAVGLSLRFGFWVFGSKNGKDGSHCSDLLILHSFCLFVRFIASRIQVP